MEGDGILFRPRLSAQNPESGESIRLFGSSRFHDDSFLNRTDSVASAAPQFLRHRILTNFAADAEGLTSTHLIKKLLETIPEPSEKDYAPAAAASAR